MGEAAFVHRTAWTCAAAAGDPWPWMAGGAGRAWMRPSMTLARAGLAGPASPGVPRAQRAMAAFYAAWQEKNRYPDAWFALLRPALPFGDGSERVVGLLGPTRVSMPAAPNSIRAVLATGPANPAGVPRQLGG